MSDLLFQDEVIIWVIQNWKGVRFDIELEVGLSELIARYLFTHFISGY